MVVAPPRVARILIVDDSAVMRSLLRSVVISDQRLEVAGTASDGASALRTMDSLRPDLILLDVEMPVMDGLSTLKQMKSRGMRVPVIMCSSLTQRGAKVTIEALASGAADYVAKPSGQASREAAVKALAQDLIPKILALTAASTSNAIPSDSALTASTVFPVGFNSPAYGTPGIFTPLAQSQPQPQSHSQQQPMLIGVAPAVLLIGVSTGGPAALDVLLPALPASFPLPVLVVQHMPELFTKMLAERLDSRCPLRVFEAVSGQPIRPGAIYIAKGNWHMEIASTERYSIASPSSTASSAVPILRLTQDAPENHCRPAVDVLFRTGVAVYGSRVLGVVLTGMGSDGLAGCRLIREHNGAVLAQDQPTSAVWGMPGAVANAGLAHHILPLNAIVPEILRLVSRSQREAIELRESAV
jgi:two-component system, chemotaxis family, protein-glutamate methylesterase/glutaminase